MKSLFCALCFSSSLLFAQATSMGPNDRPQEYQAKGGLFSVKLIPGAKETKLIVVGNEVAKIKVDKLHVTATLKFGKDERVIQFQRFNDHFVTTETLKGDLHLKLNSKDSPKSDEVIIKMIKD